MTTEISNTDDMIDVRDVIERVEELRAELSDAHDDSEVDDVLDMRANLTELESLLSDLAGNGGDHEWEGVWYPVGLIHETYFVEAMKQLCEDIGDFRDGIPGYYVIDWDATADNLRADYSSVDYDGQTYWYR